MLMNLLKILKKTQSKLLQAEYYFLNEFTIFCLKCSMCRKSTVALFWFIE